MEYEEGRGRLADFFRKYRWAAAVALTGLFLMALPTGKEPETEPEVTVQPPQTLQQELELLLSQLEGAGEVKVLLTENVGAETFFQTDGELRDAEGSSQQRKETVIISTPDRSETGLVRRVDPPKYLGAVVLCRGGDSPRVRLSVVEAVATATGLTSDKISVLKMK